MLCSRILGPAARTIISRVQKSGLHSRSKIGNREVVGFGFNGEPNYMDRTDFPFPAIRFVENSPEVMALREKERGDWRRLSLDEKKCLYRISFCSTFAEMKAPTGEWKTVVAWTLILVSLSLWVYKFLVYFAMPEAPSSFSEESRALQYWRQEGINNQPITGNYKPKNADRYRPIGRNEDNTTDKESGGEKHSSGSSAAQGLKKK